MKKLLLATTASAVALMLAASGPAMAQKKSQKISIKVGGYMEQWFGYVDEENDGSNGITGRVNFDQIADGEIHFKGSTKLDNGLKFGVKWELEGDSTNITSTKAFDEATLYVSGSFGRINLGSEDVASELMGYGAPSVGVIGINKNDGAKWVREPSGFGTDNGTHSLDLGMADQHNITYFTPRVSGFQFGASYVPNGDDFNAAVSTETSTDHNGVSLGLNYVSKIGKTKIAVSTGWMQSENADGGTGKDANGWVVGFNIGTGGFTLGGAYLHERNTKGDQLLESWDIAVRYKAGANQFSIGYIGGSHNETGNEDEFYVTSIGYTRVLGPGVSLRASIAKVDFDGSGTGGTNDNDGIIIVTGIDLEF